jgi:NAD(P)-dependent dehydrogenase (short-subunit alcohol dehydrogenase family)
MNTEFSGRAVFITGATRGIGRATAERFAKSGARVALGYRSDDEGALAAAAGLPGEGHIAVKGDISQPSAAESVVSQVVTALGSIDILVNNAAVRGHHPIASTNYENWLMDWEQILATNLTGAANVAFCAARHMMARGYGRIINVSSRGAFRGEPDMPAYGASKAGLNALTQSLAIALGPYGISVSAVAPGFVETEGTAARLSGPEGDAIRAQSPLGRVATAEEVAAAIAFLASDEAGFATGTILDVNGASYLRS